MRGWIFHKNFLSLRWNSVGGTCLLSCVGNLLGGVSWPEVPCVAFSWEEFLGHFVRWNFAGGIFTQGNLLAGISWLDGFGFEFLGWNFSGVLCLLLPRCRRIFWLEFLWWKPLVSQMSWVEFCGWTLLAVLCRESPRWNFLGGSALCCLFLGGILWSTP